MDASLDLVDRYGLPLVILCLLAFAVWRVWKFFRQVGWAVPTNLRRDVRSPIQFASDGSHKNALVGTAQPQRKRGTDLAHAF